MAFGYPPFGAVGGQQAPTEEPQEQRRRGGWWTDPREVQPRTWSTGHVGSRTDPFTGELRGIGSNMTGGFGVPGSTEAFEAEMARQARLDENFQNAIAALGQGGDYGLSNTMQGWMGSDFFTPEEMQLQRNMLAETETGARESQLRNVRQRGHAAGFGDSMGLIDAESRVRGQSAGRLQRGYNELAIDAKQKTWQVRMQAAQILMQRFGLDQQRAMQIANLWAQKQEQAVTPPAGYGGEGGTIDPFNPGGGGNPYQGWM